MHNVFARLFFLSFVFFNVWFAWHIHICFVCLETQCRGRPERILRDPRASKTIWETKRKKFQRRFVRTTFKARGKSTWQAWSETSTRKMSRRRKHQGCSSMEFHKRTSNTLPRPEEGRRLWGKKAETVSSSQFQWWRNIWGVWQAKGISSSDGQQKQQKQQQQQQQQQKQQLPTSKRGWKCLRADWALGNSN